MNNPASALDIYDTYSLGLDVLGAQQIYTDKATVEAVQKALEIKVDGVIGPKTREAVRMFNERYGGASGSGEAITDDTLKALGISPATAATMRTAELMQQAAAPAPSKARAAEAGASSSSLPASAALSSGDGFFNRLVPGVERPVWQVMVGGLGVIALTFGVVGLVRR